MTWFEWAMAARGLLVPTALNEGFTRGGKAAVALGGMNANFVIVSPRTFFLFREQLQPTKLVGLAATLSGLWLMAR